MSAIVEPLVGIHMLLAMMAQQPHWQLEQSEADAIAKSLANVARHYPKMSASGKIIDFVGLAGTLGIVYGPRIMATRELANEKRKGKVQGNADIFPQ